MSKERHRREDWRAWREDYRSSRPPVTCENCDTHYPRGKDEGNAIYIGYRLVQCGNCQQVEFVSENAAAVDPKAIKQVLKSMESTPTGDWIIDEILYVATTKHGITANLTTLTEALRQLWNRGEVKHRKNPFGQDCFALVEVQR